MQGWYVACIMGGVLNICVACCVLHNEIKKSRREHTDEMHNLLMADVGIMRFVDREPTNSARTTRLLTSM